MATEPGPVRLVKALFGFKGTHNDELCFNKDDIVTVTQAVDGGWWEGTLGDKTGWFPSNYVKDLSQEMRSVPAVPDNNLPLNKRDSMLFYRNIVLQSLLESERTFVGQLTTLINNYLRPLQTSTILDTAEYNRLIGNLEDITALHQRFLNSIDAVAKLQVPQQVIGGAFMEYVPQIKNLYTRYCANHPNAVTILQKKREELNTFMESHGSSSPGILSLTTSLSSPFTRLEKYPAVLKEFDRHTHEGHADRGNAQRAMSLYQDVIVQCTEARKQRETQLSILGGSIQGWRREEIESAGDVLLMSNVRLCTSEHDITDQILMVFQSLLVLITINPRLSGYILTMKQALHGLSVSVVEDYYQNPFCFELTGSVRDHVILSCSSVVERLKCMEVIRQQALRPLSKPVNIQISTSQPSISTLTKSKLSNATPMAGPGGGSSGPGGGGGGVGTISIPKTQKPTPGPWVMSCLRPAPPMRPIFSKEDGGKGKFNTIGRRKPVDDSKTLEEDAMILHVVEAYCTSAKTRHTVNSSLLESPHLLIAEDEKLILEDIKNNHVVFEEKTLVDTVYSLRDQLMDVAQEQRRLRKDLEEEKRARLKLDSLVARVLVANKELT